MKKIIMLSFLIVSTMLFSQWVKIGFEGQTISSVTANMAQNIIFAVADNDLYSTADDGINWTLLSVDTGQVNVVEVDEATQNLYVGTSKGLYISENNGVSFQGINTGLPGSNGNFSGVSKILITNTDLVLATNSGVYISDKTTVQFSNISGILSLNLINDLDFDNGSYYASLNTGLYKKTGTTDWQLILNKQVTGFLVQNNEFFATTKGGCSTSGSNEVILKSINTGQNWINITPNLIVAYCTTNSIFGVGNYFFIGGFYGSYQTFNNGQTFSYPIFPTNTTVIEFNKTATGILAATEYYSFINNSGGLYYWDNSILQTTEISTIKTIIYPVPSKDFVYINNKSNTDQNITIYNTVGQKVLRTRSRDAKIKVDIRSLVQGIYYVEISNGKEISKQKIIKN